MLILGSGMRLLPQEAVFGSRSELSVVMWVLEPGFLAFYPMADQRIKGKVTACVKVPVLGEGTPSQKSFSLEV